VSTSNLELPPYRPQGFWKTIFILPLLSRTDRIVRAIVFLPQPAGAVIWANFKHLFGEMKCGRMVNWGLWTDFGFLLGLNGVILVAYIVSHSANEIVIPTILTLTVLVTGITGRSGKLCHASRLDSD